MSDEQPVTNPIEKPPAAPREISSIAFPYDDLETAISVARTLYENAGGGEAALAQLAGWMKQTVSSGAFRLKISAARTFGLIENMTRGNVRLTNLGAEILDPSRARSARVESFLTVPLYGALYEKYKGHLLPPAVGLEREIANLGVSSKQKDKARQVFERSADQAGFFQHGKDRLVLPGGAVTAAEPPTEAVPLAVQEPARIRSGGGGADEPPALLNPFVQGLLAKLPEPEGEWTVGDRAKWLQTAANIFDLIYDAGTIPGGTIVVEVKTGPKGDG